MITVPAVGDDDREPPQFVSRASLVRIIKPRVEEILEMVRDRLAASPFAAEPRARVILTGGGSQLTGLPELAARILNRPVRIGRPLGISGLARGGQGPGLRRRRRPSGLSAGGASRTFRTAANAAADDRDRLHRPGRTMAAGELLMTQTTDVHHEFHPSAGGRPARPGGVARTPAQARGNHEHQPEDPRHPRAEAADHRVRRRRRRRQRRQQHDHGRASGGRLRRRQHRRPGADHVEGRAHHPDGRAGHRRSRRRLAARSRPRRGRRGDRRDPRSSDAARTWCSSPPAWAAAPAPAPRR